MTIKVGLPGGNWAELRDADDLTGSDQDAYFDRYDEIMAAKPQPEPRPDPANPAVMLEAPRPRFTNRDGRDLRDWLLDCVLVSWSYGHSPKPFAEAKKQIPVRACNALYDASRPVDAALSGTEKEAPDAPKQAAPTGTGGSSDTSEAGTGSPLQGSPGGTSGTP